MSVRKWTIPLMLAGLGGVGAALFTGRGRQFIRQAAWRLEPKAKSVSAAWNEAARNELTQLQQAVSELERNLDTHPAS